MPHNLAPVPQAGPVCTSRHGMTMADALAVSALNAMVTVLALDHVPAGELIALIGVVGLASACIIGAVPHKKVASLLRMLQEEDRG